MLSNPTAPPASGTRTHPISEGHKSYVATLLLSYFLGMFGADRFYLGKTKSALVKLFTLGGFGYWWLIDLLITLFGGQRDATGLRLMGYERHKKTVWIVFGAFYGCALAIGLIGAAAYASFDSTGPTTFGWILLGTIAAGAITTGAVLYFRRRARAKRAKATRGTDPVPRRLRVILDKLSEVRAMYVMHAASGNDAVAALVRQVDSMTANTVELFARLAAKSYAAERDRAEEEYGEKLSKLAGALDRGYLLDVIANPRLWDDPDQRIRDVHAAVSAVDAQLLDNVRQVNAHKSIVFTVAIDGLIGPQKAMDNWQREFDRVAGESTEQPGR